MNYRLKKLLVQERKKEKANSQIKMKNNVFTTYILNTLASREREVKYLYIYPKEKDRNVTVNSACKENRNPLSIT